MGIQRWGSEEGLEGRLRPRTKPQLQLKKRGAPQEPGTMGALPGLEAGEQEQRGGVV